MGSGLSRKASLQHAAQRQHHIRQTSLMPCNCNKPQSQSNQTVANKVEQKSIQQTEYTSALSQERQEKSCVCGQNNLMNKHDTIPNTSLVPSVESKNDLISPCNCLNSTQKSEPTNKSVFDKNRTITSEESSLLQLRHMPHANSQVSMTHTSIQQIQSDTTPLNCSVKRPTLFKINPLTPPSLSLIAARQESSTTPLYRKTRKSIWLHNNRKNNQSQNVISEDNVLYKPTAPNHEDVDSLMSLSSDVQSQVQKEQKLNKGKIRQQCKEVQPQQTCMQQQAKSQTNYKVIIMQSNRQSSQHHCSGSSNNNNNNNQHKSQLPCTEQEECTKYKASSNHAQLNEKDSDDDFVLFPSLQTRLNWRQSASLVSNESTSFITATSSCNTNTNTDESNNNNTNNINCTHHNSAAFRSQFPLFLVRSSIVTSSSVPVNSQVLDTPLTSKSQTKLTYTAGNSATYLLDPPSLNNYIERHAKLLHSTPQSNSDLHRAGNDCYSTRSNNNNVKDAEDSSIAQVPSMQTLLNCSFDSRAFANLSKSFRAGDYPHNTKQQISNSDNDNIVDHKQNNCNKSASNTPVNNVNCNTPMEVMNQRHSASSQNMRVEIANTHPCKLPRNAKQMSDIDNAIITCTATNEGQTTQQLISDNCPHNIAGKGNVSTNLNNTASSKNNDKSDSIQHSTNNAMQIVDYLSHFVHEPANKQCNSVRWFRTNVQACKGVNNVNSKQNNASGDDQNGTANTGEISNNTSSSDNSDASIIREQLQQKRQQRRNRLCNVNKNNSINVSAHTISWEPYEYTQDDVWHDSIDSNTPKQPFQCKLVNSQQLSQQSEISCTSHERSQCSHEERDGTLAHKTKMALSFTSPGKWRSIPISPILVTPYSSNTSAITNSPLHMTGCSTEHSSHSLDVPTRESASHVRQHSQCNAQSDRLSRFHRNTISDELDEQHPLQIRQLHQQHHHHRHLHKQHKDHHSCMVDNKLNKQTNKAHANVKSKQSNLSEQCKRHQNTSLLLSASSTSLQQSTSSSSFSSSSSSSSSSPQQSLSFLCKSPHVRSEKTLKQSASPRSNALLVVQCAQSSKRSPQINVIVPPSVSLSHLSRVNNESSTNVSRHSSFNTNVSYHNDVLHARSVEADEAILNPLNEMTEFVATQCYDNDVCNMNRQSNVCTNVKTFSISSAIHSESSSSSSNDVSKSDIDKRIGQDTTEHNACTEAQRIREEGNPFFCPTSLKLSSTETGLSLRYKANSPLLSTLSSQPTSSLSSSLQQLQHTSTPCTFTSYSTPSTAFYDIHNATHGANLLHVNRNSFTLCNAQQQSTQQSKDVDSTLSRQVQSSEKEQLLSTCNNIREPLDANISTTTHISAMRKHRKPIISASTPFKQQLAKRADEDYELFVMFRRKGKAVLKHNVSDDSTYNLQKSNTHETSNKNSMQGVQVDSKLDKAQQKNETVCCCA